MERLRGSDALFLYLESAPVHLHLGFAGVLDPRTAAEPYSFERTLDLIAGRLHLFDRFRQRLASVPFGVHHPVWVDADGFDVEYHVRRAGLPTPGGPAEFAAFVGEVMSRPLDRARPLWELYLIEGLEHGNIGFIAKAHHSIVDGVGGTDMLVALLDLEADPPPVPPPAEPWRPQPVPSAVALLASAVGDLARQPRRAVSATRRLGGDIGRAVGAYRRQEHPVMSVGGPRTRLNAAIGPRRKVAFASFALDDARQIKQVLGGTVNDVVLAACGGALRDWLERHGDRLEGSLTATLPVSVRTEEEAGAPGNRLAGLIVSLATDLPDPAERLRAIAEATAQAKEIQGAVSARLMTDWLEFATPVVAGRAFRFLSRTRLLERTPPLFNVSISNIPGPQFPLYFAGARVVSMYPMGPVMNGSALTITVVSYDGMMLLGLIADRDLVPDLDELAGRVPTAIAQLLSAATA